MRVEDRKFVFTVSAAFVVLAGILMLRGRSMTAMIPAGLAALLMLASVLLPRTIPVVHRGWMSGAHAMSRVTTPIILGIVYYLVLTPTGLIRRMAGKSSLRRQNVIPSATRNPHVQFPPEVQVPRPARDDKPLDTFWVTREVRARPPADMRRQF